MKTIHINLYGGPGTGKSTIASALFANLKWKNINCELINEYAKELVWEGSINKLSNQIYVFSKQHRKHFYLDKKVDFVITDSPIILSCIYDGGKTEYLKELVISEFNKFENINIFLNRTKPYNEKGRNQDEQEAKLIDGEILNFLNNNHIKYSEIDATENCIEEIMNIIFNKNKPVMLNDTNS